MSIFDGSSLRKLNTTPFTTRVRQKDSGVGSNNAPFSQLRSAKPVSFLSHVRTARSGVAAPADSLEFSSRAYNTGARITKGIRLAVKENQNRQNRLSNAMKRAGRFNPTPVLNLTASDHKNKIASAYRLTDLNRTQAESARLPLNGALSLSIATAPNFRTQTSQTANSTTLSTFERGFTRPNRFQIAEFYAAFDQPSTESNLDTAI
jgi:hypothetical protein